MTDDASNLLAFPETARGSGGSAQQGNAKATPQVAFDRRELQAILRVYGRMVAAGEWRDYAIDMLKDRAIFSVFRRTSEMPLYRIEKDPGRARKQGAYQVVAAGGLILKRGHDLSTVLRIFERQIAANDRP